jgi:uncharacterized heparinase superfamily protein
LNNEHQLDFPEAWNSSNLEKLWLYNLHYFDDLNSVDSENRREWHEAFIRRWMKENPAAYGNGWEPYPLSLRIVNWIKWALAGNNLGDEALNSLAVQTRQLRRRLEFHLLGNHLFENAKALIFSGLFFAGDEAEEWFGTGMRILSSQAQEQVLPDGAHFELSPMYHALILEGMLDLVNIHYAYQQCYPDSWDDIISRMFEWLEAMCHPNGDISFFNDAALGVAPSFYDLMNYARGLGLTVGKRVHSDSRLLEPSGYCRLKIGEALLLADVAAIGPDYLPGHAHADSLSFELSLFGERVLVNSGTSEYGDSAERLRQRGTAAHNTIRLDECDSSEVWSGFRVARRARVNVESFIDGPQMSLQAIHDGYTRLPGRPIHRRRWVLDSNSLELKDSIEGDGDHLVEIFFHFHPSLRVQKSAESSFDVSRADGSKLLSIEGDRKIFWSIEPGSWHPEFGVSRTNSYLHGVYRGALPLGLLNRFTWHK